MKWALIILIFSSVVFAEDFKLPEKGSKFTIKYTQENDGDFKDIVEEIKFIDATIDDLFFSTASGDHKIPRTYVSPSYRKLFFEEDFIKHQNSIIAAKQRKALTKKYKEQYQNLTEDDRILYKWLQFNLERFPKYIDSRIKSNWSNLQKQKNKDSKYNKQYLKNLEADHSILTEVQRKFKSKILDSTYFLGLCFDKPSSINIFQVIDKNNALVKINGNLYYYSNFNTSSLVDGRTYKINNVYAWGIGSKTYSSANGGSNTVTHYKVYTTNELSKIYKIFKAMNSYR